MCGAWHAGGVFVVDAQLVGTVAMQRMVRDRVLVAATNRFAFPVDIEPTPGVRAWCVAPLVPAHTVLSGLAGLWVWKGGAWPGGACVVGRRGLHRANPRTTAHAGSEPVGYHSGLAWSDAATRFSTFNLASPARCCIDALRWEDHVNAIPAVASAVCGGGVTVGELGNEYGRDNPHGLGYTRLRHVWHELAPVLTGLEVKRAREKSRDVRC